MIPYMFDGLPSRIDALVIGLIALQLTGGLFADEPGLSADPAVVDSQSLHHKVLCGYQGWFRCPGDAAGHGWRHWSRNGRRLSAESLTFEMWPDLTDYSQTYPVSGFTNADGNEARLFSSVDASTVDLHFRWMQQYGLDGVFLQRFLVEVDDPALQLVLDNVRHAVKETGRVYALCYDLSGAKPESLCERLIADWKQLVDEQHIMRDDRYLRHNGRPVLFVWGFFEDRFPAALAHRLLDLLQAEGPYQATIIGGCQWDWRRVRDPEWRRAFERLDVLSPWNVGNVERLPDHTRAATGAWRDDLAACREHGQDFLPVIYPGFGWTNLKGPEAARATIPRNGGEFFWQQFSTARELGVEMAYVAMFDEVDEATAIFKVTNSPPTPGRFATYEGLPTDWYLRLAREGTRLLRGERPAIGGLPIESPDPAAPARNPD